MYHGRFKGTHYDAGYQHGKLLADHANVITGCPTFEITDELKAFAHDCNKDSGMGIPCRCNYV